MGRTFIFECPKCLYRAYVAGGADAGFRFAIQTILCQTCKELHDAVVRLRIPAGARPSAAAGLSGVTPGCLKKRPAPPTHPPTFPEVLNRLWPRGVRSSRWVQFPLLCPKGTWHNVRPWNRPDCCPKCGVVMEQTALPYRLWE